MKNLCIVVALLCACSTDDPNPGRTPASDATVAKVDGRSATPTPDAGAPPRDLGDPSKCGPGIYPCGPYGTKVGDVIKNLVFDAYADPDHLCKDSGQMKPSTGSTRKVMLRDFFQGGKTCGTKKHVLWMFVAAGWCHACEIQVQQLAPLFSKGQVDKRIGLVTALFQDRNYKPPTPAYTKTWLTGHKVNWPVLIDPTNKMRPYFPINATPLNVAIDLKTMKIIYSVNGASITAVARAMQPYLR